MPNYKCKYEFASDNYPETSDRQISAEMPQEAYAEYLKQVGVRQIPVVVSWFAGAKRSEYFDDHVNPGQGESRQGSVKNPVAKTSELASKSGNLPASSTTDMLLKQQIAKLEEIRVIAVWFWWWFIGFALIAMVLSLLILALS